ncbi:BON domain-containing protein [Bordetella genomosp. 1]|uniref:BON domain-containing protein n=1 Tax=Bordetella genomosp. 1 TaxID=1395607 RepID=A0ABX4EXI4_9BORD|nr:BON domain-containing protein [Bordetella genomosp. 1]OZI63798.1 hypothetical protein CAL27_14420 [Bordetella genomosp. 1]
MRQDKDAKPQSDPSRDTPPAHQRAGHREDDPGRHPDPAGGQDGRTRGAQDHESRKSGQFGADEPDYGRPKGQRPEDYVGGEANEAGPQYEEGGRYPGTRGGGDQPRGADPEDPEPDPRGRHPGSAPGKAPGTRAVGRDTPVRSRSADPGQSSYGGFSHEDPSYQRQQMNDVEDLDFYRRARDPWGRQPGLDSDPAREEREQWRAAQSRAMHDAPTYIDPRGYVRSDERVREFVCERLATSGLDVSDVSVEVADGAVTLEGTVADRRVKHRVEDCVDSCIGVKDVDNRIRVALRGR